MKTITALICAVVAYGIYNGITIEIKTPQFMRIIWDSSVEFPQLERK